MKLYERKQDCCGCTACANICPALAITTQPDEEGFLYPVLDQEKCTECLLCTKVCPASNPTLFSQQPVVYACTNKNEELSFQSSSGGFFTLIAENVLENNGVVFGASFTETFAVNHIMVDNTIDLQKLRGSKYLQSNINETYKLVKSLLEEQRPVLFSGTPCQITGLSNYLKKQYENLILIDLVCHGAPSPGVFGDYLKHMNKRFQANISDVSFRAKELAAQALRIKFANGDQYLKKPKQDPFYKAFLRNLILRPSCYECKYKNLNTPSDITMGDYWGVSTKFPDLTEKDGVSLIIIKTEKGKRLFEKVKDKIDIQKSELEHAIKYNYPIVKPSPLHERRTAFFREYTKGKKDIDVLLKKHVKQSSMKRILKKLRKKFLKG